MKSFLDAELQAIGYWSDPNILAKRPDLGPNDSYVRFLARQHEAEARSGQLFLPDPNRIIEALGLCSYDQRVLSYLDGGIEVAAYLGFSTCRCCAIADDEMGSRDLTDGTWVWPDGLSHYLRVHRLPLPDPFLRTMNQNSHAVPILQQRKRKGAWPPDYDFTFWHAWAAEVYSRGRA
jgi:hypothetical protein